MEWPSKNVPRGGMLHPHRVRFNPETKNYLKKGYIQDSLRNKINISEQILGGVTKTGVSDAEMDIPNGPEESINTCAITTKSVSFEGGAVLMDESKMAMAQRKKSEYNLRDYESTPTPRRKSKKRYPKVTIRPGSSKRRSYDSIVQSGALEREPFVPKPIVNREAEKKKLQDSMTYGKEGPPKPVVKKPAKKPEKFRPLNRFDQLVQEIRDREDWIAEMAQLGQDRKYKEIIDLQIQERIREMNRLDLDDSQTPATTVRTSV